MSIPCGMSKGLPVGMMLIGKHFDEATIYRGAYAFEQAKDWKKLLFNYVKAYCQTTIGSASVKCVTSCI